MPVCYSNIIANTYSLLKSLDSVIGSPNTAKDPTSGKIIRHQFEV